uniref:Uncharacterized protein n=1 Tax=Panagrolaimus sp. ES5 TaxID=591445 RepID=A0AC34G2A6_9BILA
MADYAPRGGAVNQDYGGRGGGNPRGRNTSRGAAFSGNQSYDRDENNYQRRDRQDNFDAPSRGGAAHTYGERNPGGYDNQTDGNEFRRTNGFNDDRSSRGGNYDGPRGGRGVGNDDRSSYGPPRGSSSSGRGGGNYGRGAAFSGNPAYDRGENDRQPRENFGAPTRGAAAPVYGERNARNPSYDNEIRSEDRSSYGPPRGSSLSGRGGGNYGRGAAFSGNQTYDREENDRPQRENRQDNYGAPTRGAPTHNYGQRNGGGYDNQTNGFDDGRQSRGGYRNNDGPRGGRGGDDRNFDRNGDGPRGGYSRGGGDFGRGPSRNQGYERDGNDYQRRDNRQEGYGAPTRGGGATHSYGDRNEFRREERANANEYDRSSYGPPRGGGFSSSARGGVSSFSSGRGTGGGGRYEDRRADENNSNGGYGGYSGYGQFEDGSTFLYFFIH